jgi:hypothetical protein
VEAPVPTPAAAPAAAPAALPTDAATVPGDVPRKPRTAKAGPLDGIDQYLWSVYQRSTTKRDSSGDFTWKDEAAAARLGLITKQYVIGGMDPDFRELLYNLGHAMDAAGLHWTILSGFRDDYRQGLASGYKAHVGNSFHGGSRATGGYGHGCAADIEASDDEGASNNAIWHFVDQHGEKYGILRPMKQIDPAHIQPSGNWHDVALNLRDKRQTAEAGYLTASVDHADANKVAPLVDTPSGVTEAQFDCVRSHHHSDFRLAGLSHHRFMPGGRMHRAMMFHRGGMHRFGRRRMAVDIDSADQRTVAEAVTVTDRLAAATSDAKAAKVSKVVKVADAKTSDTKTSNTKSSNTKISSTKISDAKISDAKISNTKISDAKTKTSDAKVADAKVADLGSVEKHAKAEASAVNRRDTKRNRVAEHTEQRPGKDAALGTEAAKRTAKAQDAKEPKPADKHADGRHADTRHADDKQPQKHAATDTLAHQAKAKRHVADHTDAADAAGKNSNTKL